MSEQFELLMKFAMDYAKKEKEYMEEMGISNITPEQKMKEMGDFMSASPQYQDFAHQLQQQGFLSPDYRPPSNIAKPPPSTVVHDTPTTSVTPVSNMAKPPPSTTAYNNIPSVTPVSNMAKSPSRLPQYYNGNLPISNKPNRFDVGSNNYQTWQNTLGNIALPDNVAAQNKFSGITTGWDNPYFKKLRRW